jgi:hypothetical protein
VRYNNYFSPLFLLFEYAGTFVNTGLVRTPLQENSDQGRTELLKCVGRATRLFILLSFLSLKSRFESLFEFIFFFTCDMPAIAVVHCLAFID